MKRIAESDSAPKPLHTMQTELVNLFQARTGHFLLESGHHGALWLDLELLFLQPERLRPFAVDLAKRLAKHDIDVVCGPLVEGAFVALMVASALEVDFCYTEQCGNAANDGLYPVKYRLPPAQREKVNERRIAIVNDVINAGSAVNGTFADLQACGGRTIAIGALLVLGNWTSRFVADADIRLECAASLPNEIWMPKDCPLCQSGIQLEDIGGFANSVS